MYDGEKYFFPGAVIIIWYGIMDIDIELGTILLIINCFW
jgi:hypothetical protein